MERFCRLSWGSAGPRTLHAKALKTGQGVSYGRTTPSAISQKSVQDKGFHEQGHDQGPRHLPASLSLKRTLDRHLAIRGELSLYDLVKVAVRTSQHRRQREPGNGWATDQKSALARAVSVCRSRPRPPVVDMDGFRLGTALLALYLSERRHLFMFAAGAPQSLGSEPTR